MEINLCLVNAWMVPWQIPPLESLNNLDVIGYTIIILFFLVTKTLFFLILFGI